MANTETDAPADDIAAEWEKALQEEEGGGTADAEVASEWDELAGGDDASGRVLNQDEIDNLLGFDSGFGDDSERTGIRAIVNSALVSYERLPMLEVVGFPVAVNPETRLSALARKRGWLVEQWDRASGAPTAALPLGGRWSATPGRTPLLERLVNAGGGSRDDDRSVSRRRRGGRR